MLLEDAGASPAPLQKPWLSGSSKRGQMTQAKDTSCELNKYEERGELCCT